MRGYIEMLFFIWAMLCLCLSEAKSQNRQTVSQASSWTGLFSMVKWHEKWAVSNEFQWRTHDVVKNKQQLIARTSINFFSHKRMMFSLGYAVIKTYPYGKFPASFAFQEHRLWQGMEIKDQFNRFFINHRFRVEQRWVEAKTLTLDSTFARADWNYFNRIRYRFMVSLPLNKQMIEKGALFLNASDEIFINFGKNINQNIFDQNRVFLGLGYQLLSNANILFGYLHQIASKADAIRFESNHTLVLYFRYNFDLSKKNTTILVKD